MRVLLFADECNPEMASEPGVVFRTIRAIVDHVDEAVVVTQIRNRDAICATDMGKASVFYLDTEFIARPVWKFSSALKFGASLGAAAKYPVQYFFERELFKAFQPQLDSGGFDIIHRVGPISSALPSPLASWCSTPFVIGPVNGGLPYPPGFQDLMWREKEWLRHVREANRLLPYVRSTYSKASAILAAYDHTIDRLPGENAARVFNFPEVGADPAKFLGRHVVPGKDRLDFLFVGRLVPFKCADVVISAFADSALLRQHRLLIVGDGPERASLEALVRSNGLEDCVTFCGWLDQSSVARMMKEADIFAFPSIRDAGAGVVAEAMMAGLVNVVVDYGPTHALITDDCGIRIPLGSRADHIRGFRVAMEGLVSDPERRLALSRNAQERAMERLSWEKRARQIVEIYRWVLKQRRDKPAGALD